MGCNCEKKVVLLLKGLQQPILLNFLESGKHSQEMAQTFKPIGYMESVFHFKNGTPRQSGICKSASGKVKIHKGVFNNPEHSLEGLQEFSHVW